MNKHEAKELMARLSALWPSLDRDGVFHAWWNALLRDAGYQETVEACETYMRSAKYPPKPAEVLELLQIIRKRSSNVTPVEVPPEDNGTPTHRLAAKSMLAELRGALQHNHQGEQK